MTSARVLTPAGLRATRTARGMTLKAFAAALGYKDLMSVWRMETGRRAITARCELAVIRLKSQ